MVVRKKRGKESKFRLDFTDLVNRKRKSILSKEKINYNIVKFVTDKFGRRWPDPLSNNRSESVKSGENVFFWVTIKIPETATPGNYVGKVKIIENDKEIQSLNLWLHIWAFSLPIKSHLKTNFQVWTGEKESDQDRRKAYRFLAERRFSVGNIWPRPEISEKNGKVVIHNLDQYEKMVRYCVDELNFNFIVNDFFKSSF